MNDWVVGLVYLFGVLHAVPVWYFGKAAGIGQARKIIEESEETA